MAPPYYSGALDHPTSSLRGSPSPPSNHTNTQSYAKPAIGRATLTPTYPSHSRQGPSYSSQNEAKTSPSERSTGRPKRRTQDNDDDRDEECDNYEGEDDSDGENAEEEDEEAEEDQEEQREQQQVGSSSRQSSSLRDAFLKESSSLRSTDSETIHKRPRLLPSLSSSFTNNSLPPLTYSNVNGEYHAHAHTHPYSSSVHSPNPGRHIPLRSSPSRVSANPDHHRLQHQHRSHHASDQSDKPPISPVVLGFQLTGADPSTRDSILSALKLKEQQQALIQQRKGTPRNEKEYKKRGPGSNPTASSRAKAKAKKAGENSSAEPTMNATEEDRVSPDMSQSVARNISSSGLSPATTTMTSGGGPDLLPIVRSGSISNLLPPPSKFVAYSQSPPQSNPNSNPNLPSQLPPIDHYPHPHLHSYHPVLPDKTDENLTRRLDDHEVRRDESERGSSGESVGRANILSSEPAQLHPSEEGGSGGEPISGKTFPANLKPSNIVASSHHQSHQQQHQHQLQQLHQYSTLPPPLPPHHSHPPHSAHLPNGRASSVGSHQRPSISVQQKPKSVPRSVPQGGYGISNSGVGGQTIPSPSYLPTSFSSSSSSSSSGRAPPPAPLSILSSHHHPSSSYQHHQQYQLQHQQGSSQPSPVPYGYSTSGMVSTPSAAASIVPPKATFLAPFERFYDALVDSRMLQSTVTELTARSAEINRRADETIHRVEDHHTRCVSVLNTLQASSTSLQDMVRKEVYVVREEFSRELDSVWQRVHTLEAAFKKAGVDVPRVGSSRSIISEKEPKQDRGKENEETREGFVRKGEFKNGRALAVRVDGSEIEEPKISGYSENEDQNQKADAQEDADYGPDGEELVEQGQEEDEDIEMRSRDDVNDDDDDDDDGDEDAAQAPTSAIVPSRKPKINLGMKTGKKLSLTS